MTTSPEWPLWEVFVRSKAGEWHVDKDRIGVTGGSQGGALSLIAAAGRPESARESS